MSLEALFCDVDDFCQCFLNQWYAQQLTQGKRKRLRTSRLSVSEIMTILIHFHQSHFRHFKGYYWVTYVAILKRPFLGWSAIRVLSRGCPRY